MHDTAATPTAAPHSLSLWPRRVGYVLMAAALLLAVAWRRGLLPTEDRLLVIGPALLIGGVGLVLVFTDLMVRALYAQIAVTKAAAEDAEAGYAPDASPAVMPSEDIAQPDRLADRG